MTALTADVVVIGAGVIGAATAFHLARLGAGSVLVIDRDSAGSGMSARSSAMVRMHYTFPGEVDLAVRSDAMFDAWIDLTGRPVFMRRTGFVRIVRPEEGDLLRANVAMLRAHGAGAEVIDGAALSEIAPGMRTDDIDCAAWEPHGGYGDGAVVAGDLLAAARDRGARFLPGTTARALLADRDSITGVRTDAGTISAGVVVLATGVWSVPLLASAGIDLPIDTELHKVAVLAHESGGGADIACIDSTTATYFRPESGGERTVIGAFTGSPGADPDQVPPVAHGGDLADLADLAGAAAQRVPALARAGIAHGVAGVYDMTPDARPMLGRLPGLAGLVLAVGLSGMGFKISPAVGEAVAELIVTGAARHVDLAPFRPSRFAENDPIRPPFPYSDD